MTEIIFRPLQPRRLPAGSWLDWYPVPASKIWHSVSKLRASAFALMLLHVLLRPPLAALLALSRHVPLVLVLGREGLREMLWVLLGVVQR